MPVGRQGFVVATSNKQLNSLQHIVTVLDINGRAGVVLRDMSYSRAAPVRRCGAGCWVR